MIWSNEVKGTKRRESPLHHV